MANSAWKTLDQGHAHKAITILANKQQQVGGKMSLFSEYENGGFSRDLWPDCPALLSDLDWVPELPLQLSFWSPRGKEHASSIITLERPRHSLQYSWSRREAPPLPSQIDLSIHKLKIYSKGTLICSERIFNVLALILSTPPDLFNCIDYFVYLSQVCRTKEYWSRVPIWKFEVIWKVEFEVIITFISKSST